MLTAEAADIFLIVASICVVLVTVLFVIVGVMIGKAALEVRMLVRNVQGEVRRFIERRQKMGSRLRFAGRFAYLFLRRLLRW